jgi:hypothetical protein
VLGDVGEFAVQALGCATQEIEGVTRRQMLAFHQDALGLADDIARAKWSRP